MTVAGAETTAASAEVATAEMVATVASLRAYGLRSARETSSFPLRPVTS